MLLSAVPARIIRVLDQKSHDDAVDAFFSSYKQLLISVMVDNFSKIYLQRRPNGEHCWEVQMYATLIVKAFPDCPAVPAGPARPLHDANGLNIDRLQQYMDSKRGPLLEDDFATLFPGQPQHGASMDHRVANGNDCSHWPAHTNPLGPRQ